MSQLAIEDLNFCQSDLPEVEQVKGSFLTLSLALDTDIVVELPNGVGAGWAAAIAIGLGGVPQVFTFAGVVTPSL